MTGIPVKFRRGGENVQGTYSFFSTLGGVGYATLYLAGGMINADTKEYFITLDSSISSDHDNYYTRGNSDLDFDLLIGKPFKVKAGTAVMNWTVSIASGESVQVTWNIYHVTSGAAETLIGTAIGDSISLVNLSAKKCIQIPITAKSFKKGEKLRINAVVTAGATSDLCHDPAGRTAPSGTATSDSFIKLPVNLPI